MNVPFIVPSLLVLLAATADTATATATTPAQPKGSADKIPRYRAAHMDTVDPAKVREFEDARHEWLRALSAKHITDGRGYFLQVGDSSFLTIRPFSSFAELDGRAAKASEVAQAVGREAQERYDTRSDNALVPPHRSEIWTHEEELDYAPDNNALSELTAGAGRMVVEELRPSPSAGETYEQAWGEIRQVLKTARYPLTRRFFFSTYGSGKLVSFWLARSRSDLTTAPPAEEVVERTLGKNRANALFQKLKSAVAEAKIDQVQARPDLSSPE